jgi:hypothetical protein
MSTETWVVVGNSSIIQRAGQFFRLFFIVVKDIAPQNAFWVIYFEMYYLKNIIY